MGLQAATEVRVVRGGLPAARRAVACMIAHRRVQLLSLLRRGRQNWEKEVQARALCVDNRALFD